MALWDLTTIVTSLTAAEAESALQSELRHYRPPHWIFSSKYSGPPPGRLVGAVHERAFRVWRSPVWAFYRNLPQAGARGVISPSGTSSGAVVTIVLTLDWQEVLFFSLFFLLLFVLAAFLPGLACIALITLPWWFAGIVIEYYVLVALLREILRAA